MEKYEMNQEQITIDENGNKRNKRPFMNFD